MAGGDRCGDTGRVEPRVVRYSERPELWDAISGLSDEVWPEYNKHGDELNRYWGQLYDDFPEWQFVLYDPDEELVLAEGHTIPLDWDGTDAGLGPGIDATVAAAFALREAGGSPPRPVPWPPRYGRATKAGACPACCWRPCPHWRTTRG